MYSAVGRMRRLLLRCSMTWADQPEMLAMTKMGVNIGVGTPQKRQRGGAVEIEVREQFLLPPHNGFDTLGHGINDFVAGNFSASFLAQALMTPERGIGGFVKRDGRSP